MVDVVHVGCCAKCQRACLVLEQLCHSPWACVFLHGCERLHFFITTAFIARMVECPTCFSATTEATYGISLASDHQTRDPLSVKKSMSHRSCDGHSLRSDIRASSWDASYHIYPITMWTGAAVKFSFALQVCMITVRMCEALIGRQVGSHFFMRPSSTAFIASTSSCPSCRTRNIAFSDFPQCS